MNVMQRAGMLRLEKLGSLVGLAMLAPASIAAGQSGASAGPIPVRATATAIARQDTSRRTTEVVIVRKTPKIDSLTRRLNELPLGSPEYFATEDSLTAAIMAQPRPSGFAGLREGTFSIRLEPSRAALRVSAMDVVPKGWFGFVADGINRTWSEPAGAFVEYFEYPTVVSVEANSPGSRAGVRFGDSLVAFNGQDLRRNPINLTRLLTPGRDVAVRLRREGESRDVVLTVESAPPGLMAERRSAAVATTMSTPATALMVDSMERRMVEARAQALVGAGGRTVVGSPMRTPRAVSGGFGVAPLAATTPSVTGVLGAPMADVDADLAQNIAGLKGRRGVFVERIPPGSPAERIGLRRGDVILRVESDDVPTTNQLRARLQHATDIRHLDKVRLAILRAGKTRDLTYEVPR